LSAHDRQINMHDHPVLKENIARVTAAVGACMNQPVVKISIPGGTDRASLRVHFAHHTIIATRRPSRRARDRELHALLALTRAGAPVPRVLGQDGDVLLQSDVGNARLSSALLRAGADERTRLVARAFDSMWDIKDRATKVGFTAGLRTVGTKPEWLNRFAQSPFRAARLLGLKKPRIDLSKVVASLQVGAEAEVFVNWDARLGNAGVSPEDRIVWFDWEYYGRRGGLEDFAFLMADEFFPLPPRLALPLFAESCPPEMRSGIPLMIRFATFRAARRLSMIRQRWRSHGAEKFADLLRTDQVGYSPQIIKNLCKHGAMFAARDPLTQPLQRLFRQAADPALWDEAARAGLAAQS